MRFLLALIDNLLADVRDSRLSQPPLEYTTLAPVWVMPMVRKAESTPRRIAGGASCSKLANFGRAEIIGELSKPAKVVQLR